MHDCNGTPLKHFDIVRAATKEELATAGHSDAPVSLSPEQQIIIGTTAGNATCNVRLISGFSEPVIAQSHDYKGGIASFPFVGDAGWYTAHLLVKVG